MRKSFLFVILCAVAQITWAQTLVTTDSDLPQGLESVQQSAVSCQKVIRNGMLFIERNGHIYNAQGQLVK